MSKREIVTKLIMTLVALALMELAIVVIAFFEHLGGTVFHYTFGHWFKICNVIAAIEVVVIIAWRFAWGYILSMVKRARA